MAAVHTRDKTRSVRLLQNRISLALPFCQWTFYPNAPHTPDRRSPGRPRPSVTARCAIIASRARRPGSPLPPARTQSRPQPAAATRMCTTLPAPPGTAKPVVRLPVMMARQHRLSHIPAPAPGRPRPSAGAGIFRHPDKPAAQISATVHCWRLPAGHSQTICPAQPRAGRTAAVAPAPGGNSPRAPAQTVRFPQAGAGLQTCPASRRRPPRFWRKVCLIIGARPPARTTTTTPRFPPLLEPAPPPRTDA